MNSPYAGYPAQCAHAPRPKLLAWRSSNAFPTGLAMRSFHYPLINLRYWVLISLVSIFGTHVGPLPVLILAYALVYFWVVIILIRTAATNIADSLFDDFGIKFYVLAGVLSALMLWAALAVAGIIDSKHENWTKKRE